MENYLEINRESWNNKVDIHINSDFYFVDEFLAGRSSLNSFELEILGDINGKSILHLQCHFGQDSISLSRLGAEVTGVDFSDKAIEAAKELAFKAGTTTKFLISDIYELPNHLDEKFDIVFTSYGTIGWLPDLDQWAKVVSHFLKPNGKFLFVEFHPFVWMYDDDFKGVSYSYFNTGPIHETYEGTYAEKKSELVQDYVMWNHPTSEVLNALIKNDMKITQFNEFNWSPYPCFRHVEEFEKGKYIIPQFGNKIPMVFSLEAKKNP